MEGREISLPEEDDDDPVRRLKTSIYQRCAQGPEQATYQTGKEALMDQGKPMPDVLAARLFAQPESPDVRVNQCLEKIRRALEEHD